MTRLINPGKRLPDIAREPNFYEISLQYPLPPAPNGATDGGKNNASDSDKPMRDFGPHPQSSPPPPPPPPATTTAITTTATTTTTTTTTTLVHQSSSMQFVPNDSNDVSLTDSLNIVQDNENSLQSRQLPSRHVIVPSSSVPLLPSPNENASNNICLKSCPIATAPIDPRGIAAAGLSTASGLLQPMQSLESPVFSTNQSSNIQFLPTSNGNTYNNYSSLSHITHNTSPYPPEASVKARNRQCDASLPYNYHMASQEENATLFQSESQWVQPWLIAPSLQQATNSQYIQHNPHDTTIPLHNGNIYRPPFFRPSSLNANCHQTEQNYTSLAQVLPTEMCTHFMASFPHQELDDRKPEAKPKENECNTTNGLYNFGTSRSIEVSNELVKSSSDNMHIGKMYIVSGLNRQEELSDQYFNNPSVQSDPLIREFAEEYAKYFSSSSDDDDSL